MPKKTAFLAVPLALLLSLAPPAPAPARAASSDYELYEGFKTLARIFYEVNVKFVEEPDSSEMVNGAVRGMLNTLDPHSSYMTPEEMGEFQQESTGSFTGVGMELSTRDSVITVVAPIDDTPASRAGLLSGDQVVGVDDKTVKDMSVMDVVKLIRGPKGTKVTISVHRPSLKRNLTFNLVRDFIPLVSVRSEILTPGIGYVSITNFQAETARDVERAVGALSSPGPLDGLVLDLRNDPGGLLDQSVKVSGLFVGPVLVVGTKGRVSDQNVEYSAEGKAILPYSCPIVVLVNEGSASASEIVAGALQDYGRATILGARTFGKGSVQSVVRLPDGSGLRLTTARFYTPSGRPIQTEGITPDVEVPSLLPANYVPTREIDLERHLKGANERDSDEAAAAAPETPADGEAPPEEPEVVMPTKSYREMTLEERLDVDKQLAQALEMLKKGEVVSGYTGVAAPEQASSLG
ncbi:MAG: S41 family peptidase [Deltaproteobacteria bacterium]|jgi:carboxyl-terminal processing protease|nr:S41 family peptidase [Deltaproteobacteria bacterium]